MAELRQREGKANTLAGAKENNGKTGDIREKTTATFCCKVWCNVLSFDCSIMQSCHEDGGFRLEALYIQMLGEFSISTGNKQISDRDNRSRKIWTLLAYLIYHRHRIVLQEELIGLLWSDDEKRANPAGALKTVFHRMRSVLNQLWPSAGHDLVLCQGGGYMWNSEVPLTIDIEQFDRLCHKGNGNDAGLDTRYYQALQLYKGDFLARMSSELWVIPIAAYYHNCYVQSLLRVLPVLMDRENYSEVAELCQAASKVELFNESIHCYLMQALLYMGDQKGAVNIYKQLSERLLSNFGIMPSEETRALYYEAIKTHNDHAVPIEVIREQLKTGDSREGALICEYDFFRVLYRSMARSMARNGIAAHIALLSVVGEGDEELSRRKLQGAMERLEEQIRFSLRRGDAAAKCSISQYIIMLPQANYENSCMVCERIIKAYYRKHPHSDANIQYAVYPLQPDEVCFK